MIKCIKCDSDISESAKFCSSCGAKVERRCTSCSATLPLAAKFCAECGAPVATPQVNNPLTHIDIATSLKSVNLGVEIISVVARGPDAQNEFCLEINASAKNQGLDTVYFLMVNTQVFNSSGLVIADTRDSYDHEISPDELFEFETSIWSVKPELLGKDPEGAVVVISVIAATGEKAEVFNGKLSGKEYETFPVTAESSLNPFLVAGSFWESKPDDDNDVYVESRILVQNLTSDYFPQAKLYLELFSNTGELINQSENDVEVVPGGVASIGVSSMAPKNDLKGGSVKLFLQANRFVGLGYAKSQYVSITPLEDEDSERSGSKSIYIKTEPGGKVLFGRLSDEDAARLEGAVLSKEMTDDLMELRFNSSGEFRECEGVFNQGEEGDFGNEGSITFDQDGPIQLPKDQNGNLLDGSYLVYLSLSKVSIEFEFAPSNGYFDVDKFTEVSVPVILPDFVRHELYGHPDYNVVIDYRYDGESIEEYDRELVDRGYDDQTLFVVVKGGHPHIVYSNYNGEETWFSES